LPVGHRTIDALRNLNLKHDKKFQIIARSDSTEQAENESRIPRFTISGVRQAPIQNTQQMNNNSSTVHSRPTGFRVAGVTRPTKCPLCHTDGEIARSSSSAWECKRCNNTWE
jgi:hypothetical protein